MPFFSSGSRILALLNELLGASLPDGGDGPRRDRIYRILLAIGAVLILGFGILYQQLSGEVTDPIGLRAGLATLALGLAGASYISERTRRHLGELYRGYIYVIVLWVTGLLIVNQYAWAYGVGVLFLHGGAGLAFGVGLRRIRPLGWFLAASTSLPLIGVLVVAEPVTPPLLLGLSLAGLTIIIFLVTAHRIRVERRLQRSRDRATRLRQEFETIFEAAQDPTFLVDVKREEGNLRFEFLRLNVTHEDLTGMETERIRGRTPREVLGEETGEEVADRYRRCVEAGEPIEYEEELPAPAGTRTWHTKLAPIFEDGEAVLIVGMARDITERTRREEQLRLLDRLIQHDLRGDVTNAQGWADMLQEGGDRRKAARWIQAATGHMIELLDATDTLQRALRSGQQMELQSVELRSHVDHAIQTCERRFPEACITVDYSSESALVRANELLGSVFENLIANGVRHNDHQIAEVDIRIEERDRQITVEVADNGPGIPPTQRKKIFEKERRGLESSGMGLGLYLVRTLVQLYGGAVEVTDNEPRGTRFAIHLKKAEPLHDTAP